MYKGSVIDDLIYSVTLAEQHVSAQPTASANKSNKTSVSDYATYMYEYFRPQVIEVA